ASFCRGQLKLHTVELDLRRQHLRRQRIAFAVKSLGRFCAVVAGGCEIVAQLHRGRMYAAGLPGRRRQLDREGTRLIGRKRGHHRAIAYGCWAHRLLLAVHFARRNDRRGERHTHVLLRFSVQFHHPHDDLLALLGFLQRQNPNPRIAYLTLKKAEQSEEIIVRMVELDGKPQENVRVSFASPVVAAREVNGQEQPMGPATVSDGAVVTSFSVYQPRTFAVKLAATTGKASRVHSAPVKL